MKAEFSIDDITIGADPEFFLYKDGTPISAHDIVPGTKLQPYFLTRDVQVQADGTAVEFNISPCRTAEEFSENIRKALAEIRKLIPNRYEFFYHPTVEYPIQYFHSLPKTATELGCFPDFSAMHRGTKNMPPRDTGTRRTAGGHIHIGWGDFDIEDPGHFFDCVSLCRTLYKYYNLYEHLWDADIERQQLYGANGAFRPKKYGVEYRGLSNAWLRYPQLWPWIFDSTKFVFKRLLEQGNVAIQPMMVYDPRYFPTCRERFERESRAIGAPTVPNI